MNQISENSREPIEVQCDYLEGVVTISDRVRSFYGWDQDRLAMTKLLSIGAGTTSGEVLLGLTRKGIGCIEICDGDHVSTSNLNRQQFTADDLSHNKAIQLAKHLQKLGFLGTKLVGNPVYSDELDIEAVAPNLMLCVIDNQIPGARLHLCQLALKLGIPIIFSAFSEDAKMGYVFFQASQHGHACWACALFPELSKGEKDHCPAEVGASIDIAKVTAGLVLYAIDSHVMERKRDWNYRVVSLPTGEFGGSSLVKPRADCPVCSQSDK